MSMTYFPQSLLGASLVYFSFFPTWPAVTAFAVTAVLYFGLEFLSRTRATTRAELTELQTDMEKLTQVLEQLGVEQEAAASKLDSAINNPQSGLVEQLRQVRNQLGLSKAGR